MVFQNLSVYENLLGLAEISIARKGDIDRFIEKSIDEFAISIPLMFSTGVADGKIFSAMFKTINVGMYDYLSENTIIHPIFLDYLK